MYLMSFRGNTNLSCLTTYDTLSSLTEQNWAASAMRLGGKWTASSLTLALLATLASVQVSLSLDFKCAKLTFV